MPLSTQIIRNGEPLVLRWGSFHIAAMAIAASVDKGEGPLSDLSKIYDAEFASFDPFPISSQLAFILTDYGALGKTPLNEGRYTLTKRHAFCDASDGEILELLPGDILVAYR